MALITHSVCASARFKYGVNLRVPPFSFHHPFHCQLNRQWCTNYLMKSYLFFKVINLITNLFEVLYKTLFSLECPEDTGYFFLLVQNICQGTLKYYLNFLLGVSFSKSTIHACHAANTGEPEG